MSEHPPPDASDLNRRLRPLPAIVIVDFDTRTDPGLIAAVAQALEVQAMRDLALATPLGWGVGAVVRTAANIHDVQPHEWLMGLFTHPDQPSALGYHDTTASGTPLMKAFPLLDEQDGTPWSTTASHEMVETLVDPLLALAFQAPDGVFWAGEVADAVEEESYKIGDVLVSNYVLPTYFQPPKNHAGPFDLLGLVKQPFEILPGGYGQKWTRRGWQTVMPRALRPSKAAALAHKNSRHARRARALLNDDDVSVTFSGRDMKQITDEISTASLDAIKEACTGWEESIASECREGFAPVARFRERHGL